MGKPRARAPPNMLLLDPSLCTLDTDPDVGLVGTATLSVVDVARLQRHVVTAEATELDPALPRVGLLNGPIGHGQLVRDGDGHVSRSDDNACDDHVNVGGASGAVPTQSLVSTADGENAVVVDVVDETHVAGAQAADAAAALPPSASTSSASALAPVSAPSPQGAMTQDKPSSTSDSRQANEDKKGKDNVASSAAITASIALYTNPPPPSPITLIIALCRIKVFGRVLETATAMGVKTFHVIDTARVEPA